MRYALTAPKAISFHVPLPASKSISNRVLIINRFAGNTCQIRNLARCDDTNVMVDALAPGNNRVDIGAAGTAMRFLTAYFSVTPGEWYITGSERMRQRPISVLVEALRTLGADITYLQTPGFPPLRIKGACLQGSKVTLRGDVSSQYVSALLMIAPMLQNGLTLTLSGNVISRPYINLTLGLMQEFGADTDWVDGKTIRVRPGQYHRERPFVVESDWSAASYWYQIASLLPQADIGLDGLFMESPQGDCRVATLFRDLGVDTVYTHSGVELVKTSNLVKRLDVDFTDIPDLAQTFMVTCACLGIPFYFTGLTSLKIKETDRVYALCAEMNKLGVKIDEPVNGTLLWNGTCGTVEPHPVISTYKDHRMAMAFAPATICYPNIEVDEPDVVTKSYPQYWEHLQMAGFGLIGQK